MTKGIAILPPSPTDTFEHWYQHGNWTDYDFELMEESKMFTKDDLKVNDWCVLKDGTVAQIIDFGGRLVVIGNDYYNDLDHAYGNDLIEGMSDYWSISKVYRPQSECDLKRSRHSNGMLVFDREKGIGCEPPVKEISVEEATKLLTEKFGKSVRIRVDE